jgi:hypothetical protein
MNNINNINTMNINSSSIPLKNEESFQALDAAYQISNFLKCGIDKNTLSIMLSML